jgi:hypothetical protein
MLQAVARHGGYSQILQRLAIAASMAPIPYYATSRPTTLFLPIDAVFRNPKYTRAWKSPLCAPPQKPLLCYVTLTLYMIAPGSWTVRQLQAKRVGTLIATLQGDNLQKFRPRPRSRYLVIGPEVGCGPQCTKKPYTAYVHQPNLYVSKTLLVHGVNRLLGPPSVWPNGLS